MMTVDEQLDVMIRRLQTRDPFIHVRYNDGESMCMFQLAAPGATTSGEHHFQPDLGKELKESLKWFCHQANCLLGSYANEEVRDPAWKTELLNYINSLHVAAKWCPSDLWYSSKGERDGICSKSIMDLLATIRRDGQDNVLICNPTVAPAKFCLNAAVVEIRPVDAWLDPNTFNHIRKALRKQSTVIWCAGFPGKVWMRLVAEQFPESTHIDAGHFFDGAFCQKSRGWLRRESGTHYNYYVQNIATYVRSFM